MEKLLVIYMNSTDDQWGQGAKAKSAVSWLEVSGSVQLWSIPGVFVRVQLKGGGGTSPNRADLAQDRTQWLCIIKQTWGWESVVGGTSGY